MPPCKTIQAELPIASTRLNVTFQHSTDTGVEPSADQVDFRLPDLSHFEGRIMNELTINEMASYALDAAKEEGYWESTFHILSLKRDRVDCRIHVTAELEAGAPVRLYSINWQGLEHYNPEFLERTLPVRTGDVVRRRDVDEVRQVLLTSGLFKEVDAGSLVLEPEGLTMQIQVEEHRQNAVDGMIGYTPGEGGGGSFAGYGDLKLRHILLDGNETELRYEQLSTSVSSLDVQVRQFYPLDLPLSVSAGFQFLQQDTLYLSREVQAAGEYFLADGFSIIGSGKVTRVVSSEERQPDHRITLWGLGFRFFELDHALVPLKGYDIGLMAELGQRSLSSPVPEGQFFSRNPQRLQRVHIDGQVYFSPAWPWVLTIRSSFRHVITRQPLVSDLFRFGGTTSVRGYREDQFRASTVFWADVEPRFLLDRETYLFVFGTVGRYHRPVLASDPAGSTARTAWVGSAGFGLAYQTPFGLMRLSYAVSPEESFSTGKVHVAFGWK